jgi:ElaB/YqjD/DUF883 family membrane-anchored ribosome-binding protein
MPEGKNETSKPQDTRLGAASSATEALSAAARSTVGGGQAKPASGPTGSREQPGPSERVRRAAEEVQDRASEAYEEATDWAKERYERAAAWASDSYGHGADRMRSAGARSARQFGRARGGMQSYIAQNPVVVGLVGLAAGLLLGALLPRTRREDEAFGEWSDEARQQGMRYAQDMARRGREYVEEAFTGEDPRYSRHASEFQRGSGTEPH